MDPGPYEYIMIKHRKSGLYLDIEGAGRGPKTKVVLWNKNGQDNQVWYLDPSTWTYRSKMHDLCITFDPEKRVVVVDEVKGYDPNQGWQISALHIKNTVNNYLVLECPPGVAVGGYVTAVNYSGQEDQYWDVERTGGHAPAKLSNCPPYQPNQPAQPYQPAQPNQPAQPYQPAQQPMQPNQGGFGGHIVPPISQPTVNMEFPHIGASAQRRMFLIQTEMNDKVVDIKKANKTAGTPIVMYKPNRQINQQWYTDEKGFIRSALNDMVFNNNEMGHGLKMEPYINNPQQQWKIDGNKIVNGKGLCLDIRGGHSNDGSELCAYTYKNAHNQHWRIVYL